MRCPVLPLLLLSTLVPLCEPWAQSTVPADALALVRADIAARGLPDASQATAPAERVRRTDEGMQSPEGESLVVVRDLEELGGEGVAMVALESLRYWTLARAGAAGAVLNGPYAFGLDEPRMTELLQELTESDAARQGEIARQLLVSAGSWEEVDRVLGGLEQGAAIGRTLGRVIHREVRSALAREVGGGFYDDQFSHLARFGSPGRLALVRILRDGQEEPEVRSYAAQALGEIGDERSADQLDELLERRALQGQLQDSAVYALARLGRRARIDAVIDNLERQLERSPDDARIYFTLAQVMVRTGDRDEALRLYRAYVERNPAGRLAGLTHYNIACTLAIGGRIDEAFAALDRAVELGGVDFDWLSKDGDLRSLHGDPRWQALLDRRTRTVERRIF